MPFSLPGMTAEGPEPPAPHETEERLAEPADQAGTAPSGDPADYVAEGMGHLDQAIAAFSAGCESGDSGTVPPANKLLARALPPRRQDNDPALVWQRGMEDPDPAGSTAVRTRLRRAFGGDEVPADEDGDPPTWWENFVESAGLYGSLPLLTNEIFGALDQMSPLAALPLAQGGGRARDLREILLSAIRVPSDYARGPELHASFHARLREAMGTETDVLPPNWPDE